MISPERLLSLTSGKAAFATRGSVAKTPYFPETISCLAVIMGEIGDSRHNPGWDENGKKTTIPNEFRESCLEAPGWKIRACFGRVSITLTLSPLGVEIRLVSLGLGSQSSLQRIA